jgi:hypothetical protein
MQPQHNKKGKIPMRMFTILLALAASLATPIAVNAQQICTTTCNSSGTRCTTICF